MPIIRIDEIEYELDHLTDEVKSKLSSIQHADKKIAELQRDLELVQIARNSFASALRELLGHGVDLQNQPPKGIQIRH